MESAAATLTTPRKPMKPKIIGNRQSGAGSRRASGGQRMRGRYAAGNMLFRLALVSSRPMFERLIRQ